MHVFLLLLFLSYISYVCKVQKKHSFKHMRQTNLKPKTAFGSYVLTVAKKKVPGWHSTNTLDIQLPLVADPAGPPILDSNDRIPGQDSLLRLGKRAVVRPPVNLLYPMSKAVLCKHEFFFQV